MKQTLWIAREDRIDEDCYWMFQNEPRINLKGVWVGQGIIKISSGGIADFFPLLKLKPGEKKQFTISVEK